MYALFCKVGKEVQLLDFDDYPLNIQQPLWPKNASEWAEMVETNKESYWIGQNRLEPAKTWPRNDWTSRKMKEIHWNIVEPAEIRYVSAETQFVPKKKTLLTQQKNKGNRLKDDWTDQNLMCIRRKYWTGQDLVDMSLDSHTNTFILTRGILIQNSE